MGFAIAVIVFLALCGALAWWGDRRRHGSRGLSGHRDASRDEAVAQHQRHEGTQTHGFGGSPPQ